MEASSPVGCDKRQLLIVRGERRVSIQADGVDVPEPAPVRAPAELYLIPLVSEEEPSCSQRSPNPCHSRSTCHWPVEKLYWFGAVQLAGEWCRRPCLERHLQIELQPATVL